LPKRIAFVTIGQSPRSDVMPDIVAACRTGFVATERGALDGLDDAQIAALAPRPGDAILASRLADGRGVLLGKPDIERRLHIIIAELDGEGFDLIVLLCTGSFGHFATDTPFLEPQHVVDHFARGLAYGAKRLGVVIPEADQADDFASIDGIPTVAAHASPYATNPMPGLRSAGRALAATDLIVTHCIGYSEAMREELMRSSGRPVLLARRLVAHAIDLVLT
jgi:protein AroM